ncbi:phosphomethylpyrimidine synthase [candidate division LCP-89 bacterium B3_LCP]|uniref:Phosphomethylpyrimidine synthase n=1 Tax=candidate division LCP-89 bacterium B3_LCP TaxID=2012998 RepID=A0A532V2V3_UNCL8|nr:MAG: phosphomethylpyrimidine synthase [candidate division LCP-89 bacterium B3_LCP]
MTQLSQAKEGIITEEMREVAGQENMDAETLRQKIAAGHVVIPKNHARDFFIKGIGSGLTTKVNANIGTSPEHYDIDEEIKKLQVAMASGVDSVMDLSTGGDLDAIRKAILEHSCVMVGTVPIYGAAARLLQQDKELVQMKAEGLFEEIERQCEQGIDYITVHCGVTQRVLEMLENTPRVAGMVSRGGSILALWMKHYGKENPLYEQYDRLLDIVFKYDVTLSLGDGLRPGAIADAGDRPQIEELVVLGDLARRARSRGVQVMIEGPGHVPLQDIKSHIQMEKTVCDGAPFYVLGPLTTDIAPGYDHITSAIGGAIAAAEGADFLCYVTPAEHLRLPTLPEVREGVYAARIAAHSGDIAKGVPGATNRDLQMSQYRRALNWEGMYEQALDSELARSKRRDSEAYDQIICTMCGKLCSINMGKTDDEKEDEEV